VDFWAVASNCTRRLSAPRLVLYCLLGYLDNHQAVASGLAELISVYELQEGALDMCVLTPGDLEYLRLSGNMLFNMFSEDFRDLYERTPRTAMLNLGDTVYIQEEKEVLTTIVTFKEEHEEVFEQPPSGTPFTVRKVIHRRAEKAVLKMPNVTILCVKGREEKWRCLAVYLPIRQPTIGGYEVEVLKDIDTENAITICSKMRETGTSYEAKLVEFCKDEKNKEKCEHLIEPLSSPF
jgi:hypothetical protein